MIFNLGPYQSKVDARLEQWEREKFLERLWERDPTLWFPRPVPEITDRLGWLFIGKSTYPQLEDLVNFAHQVRMEGITDVVLLGMGGSSLAPEVFQKTFGNAKGFPALTVLDSTHPAAVQNVRGKIDPQKTLFIISSKSGTTLETLSLFKFFWNEMRAIGGERGRHFIAITDPGTPLARLASERGFRQVFEAPPDVGGRFSALTVFGLVPAALIGIDLFNLLDFPFARGERDAAGAGPENAHALALGAALGELALSGRDKVTILASPSVRSFPSWIEQLMAESTGKNGKGIIPIIDEPLLDAASYPSDRFFIGIMVQGEEASIEDSMKELDEAGHPTVRIILEDKIGLGQEIFNWEVAVASAAAVLGVHPFNQPDVQMTKDLTKKMMLTEGTEEAPREKVETLDIDDQDTLRDELTRWAARSMQNDYVSIQAYLEPNAETAEGLHKVRQSILTGFNVATSLDYGPRFLHSTGQLHKGGPNTGLFLQLIDEIVDGPSVPETDYTFGELIQASASGDYVALRHLERRILRIDLKSNVPQSISKLTREINDLAFLKKMDVIV
jgi:transaldolase / glucose-6-phosphate isomerase